MKKVACHAAIYASAFLLGMYTPWGCSARADVPDATPLKKGQPAPWDGDLVLPEVLVELYIDSLCVESQEESKACMKSNEAKLDALRQELKLVDAARATCELRPPITVEVVKPVTFFERPVVVLTLGILTGGLLVWAASAASN